MQLRPYQLDLIDRTRDALRRSQRVLIQAPTGSGKTAITVYMMSRAAAAGRRAWFLVHQNELLGQTSRALWKQNLAHGVIASGKRPSTLPAQVASVQTLVRRLGSYSEPDLIIIDECHRSAANTYQRILEAYPSAKVIGLTATPERTDGKGLDDTYSELVQGPSVRQLIDAGYLCEYEIFAPPTDLDLSGVRTKMGDFDREQLGAAMDRPTITGDAVRTYLSHAAGKRAAVLCVTLQHAEHVRDSYRASGVPAEMIDGRMTNKARDAVIERLRTGETRVVTSVNLMIEGLDVPGIEVVQWLRPTQSLIVYMQGNGRGFRVADGKDRLLILDHVGNWRRHGLPDDDREWSLEGRKRNRRKADDEADVRTQQCGHCFHIFRPGPDRCPSCDHEVERKKPPELVQVDGDLVKLDRERVRRELKREQGMASGLQELVALGIRRGMKNPAGWAANVHAARGGSRPTPRLHAEAKRIRREIEGATA